MKFDPVLEVASLLRARTPLIWVVTREESRVERLLIEAAMATKYEPLVWDMVRGICNIKGEGVVGESASPDGALQWIARRKEGRRCFIMRDLAPWVTGSIGIGPQRMLRNLARAMPALASDQAQAIIVLTPNDQIPLELQGNVTVVQWPMPTREDIADILDAAIAVLPDDLQASAAPNGNRDAAIDAAIGLTGLEAQSCFAKSLVQSRTIDPALVSSEKKRVVSKDKLIEWFDPLPNGLDSVGGLDGLKAWLATRKNAYSKEARAYGLPSPKGLLLVGVSGCGKSLTAKAIATAWGIPLLRLDLGALKSKYVGESEANLRKAFQTIEAVGRCVVWCDEIEKALQGATSGSADGGVSSDALGALLTFMQERQGASFIVATANDISGLPPEFLRKGRFDEVFYIDLPNHEERQAIIKAALREYKRNPDLAIDYAAIADATKAFTGAEIAAIVPDSMFMAFNDDGRELATADLVKAASEVIPLSSTAREKIGRLRQWAKGRARSATIGEQEPLVKIERDQTIEQQVLREMWQELEAANKAAE